MNRLLFFRRALLASLLLAPLWVQSANAGLLIETSPPFSSSVIKPTAASNGFLARVDVGGSDVDVDAIGVYVQVNSPLSMKWVIFGNTPGASPLFETGVSAFGPSAQQWLDSPTFAPVALLANQTYWIGSVVDGPLSALNHFYNFPGSTVIANGLTVPFRTSGNTRGTFASPTNDPASGGVQPSVRLFGPGQSAAEPASALLLSLGLAGLGAAARRRLTR